MQSELIEEGKQTQTVSDGAQSKDIRNIKRWAVTLRSKEPGTTHTEEIGLDRPWRYQEAKMSRYVKVVGRQPYVLAASTLSKYSL